MKFNDIIKYSFKNMEFKGLRSWLTIIGIVIGIASVVGLLTYSESVNSAISRQLGSFGSDIISVSPGAPSRATELRFRDFQRGQQSASAEFTDDDINAVKAIPLVVAVSPIVTSRKEVVFDVETVNVNIKFIQPSEYNQVNTINVDEGYFIDDNDDGAVLGYSVAKEFFSNEIKVGDSININSHSYKVVGILAQQGGFSSDDNSILLDFSQASSIIDGFNSTYQQIQVKPASMDSVEETTSLIQQALRESRNVEEGSEDFQVSSSLTMMNNVSSILGTLTIFIVGIATISLLVGAISISNTMFTSVYEKTKEIGIMKAIGAEDSEVMWLFITESAIISLIGGIGGIILGIFIAHVLVNYGSIITMPMAGARGASAVLTIKPELIASAILFSVIVGVISGYFPARKAAKLDPIQAIWYE